MKLLNKLAQGFAAVVLSLFASLLMSHAAYAIPYNGDSTQPTATPTFNAFTGVPGEGNESDFLRGRVATDTTSVNDVNSSCETGKRFLLRVYVHNGADQNKNGEGNGPSVAKNSKVKINLDNSGAKTSFTPSATLSASNAATVTDTMNIRCSDGKVVKLSYVDNTAEQYNQGSGVQKINDDLLFSTGAPIGTKSPNGDMWGCWDQRVLVRLIVEVKEQPVVVPTDAICKLEDGQFIVVDNKKRTVSGTIVPQLTNATVLEYKIDWGDGKTSNKQSDTHSYSNYGRYTIQASLRVRLNDGTTKWVDGPNCATTVEFSKYKPPVVVVPPTVTKLVGTGAAGTFGIFTAVTAVAGLLHRAYIARKFNA